MIVSLFPTPVGRNDIGREFTVKELKAINALERNTNAGNQITKNQDVLGLKELSSVRKYVDDALNEFFQSVYKPQREVRLDITQSWINFSKKGDYHHTHTHQNSFLSGVFYIKADREKDKIYFYKEEYAQLRVYSKEYNEYNSYSWWIEVGGGDLLLFPSSMSHGVNTVETDERISLSFNTFPVGLLGGHYYSNSLEILKIGPGNRD